MKNKKLAVWFAVLAVTMALATPAQAYESREAIVSQGHGACSPTYCRSMRRGTPVRVRLIT